MDNRGLEKLDQWLLKYGNDDSILSASELDGFFAAILVRAPDRSEYAQAVATGGVARRKARFDGGQGGFGQLGSRRFAAQPGQRAGAVQACGQHQLGIFAERCGQHRAQAARCLTCLKRGG